jgi:hypothetical protein
MVTIANTLYIGWIIPTNSPAIPCILAFKALHFLFVCVCVCVGNTGS